ncbi:PREDICTED: uncharacterized protein LOC106106444 [Papilio polytes]|uniref:uncharacterized protein LOC106106444 n=1 Tax=Papilio polytes TaxID=76194 RepID=UPI0006767EC5|nr:PREDICTED: uncharacterized protein LOC106106444 [Papilio polytes]
MFKSFLATAAFVLCVYRINCSIEGTTSNEIQTEKTNTSERTGRSLNKECNNSLNAKCIKIHVLSFLEDLSSRDELTLLPGLSIVKENYTSNTSPEEMAAELSRQFPGKPEEKLNRFLIYRLQDYLDGHSLRYKLLDPKTSQEALDMANGEESVGRKGGGGGLGGGGKGGGGGALLAAALMMKGALGAAALGALALLAGKALMTALMSLLLSALVGLKGGGGHKSTTYEIITKPEVSHHHSHSHEEHHEHEHGHHGGYRRAYDADYNSYMPYDNVS